jgi:hypothetical protein
VSLISIRASIPFTPHLRPFPVPENSEVIPDKFPRPCAPHAPPAEPHFDFTTFIPHVTHVTA